LPSSPPQLDFVLARDSRPDAGAILDEVETLLLGLVQTEPAARSVLESARERANGVCGPLGAEHRGRWPAVMLAGEVVAGLALDQPWEPEQIDRLAQGLAGLIGLPAGEARHAVFAAAIADPRLLSLPPGLAIEVTLRLLMAFTGVASTTFWLRDEELALRCVVRLGGAARRTRAVAQAALRAADQQAAASVSQGAVPVRRWQHVAGVLAVQPHKDRSDAELYVKEAARMLGLALEREALLDRAAARERALVEASERRLTRLGYDVHDGPLQDIGAARRELCLLRDSLAELQEPGAMAALVQLRRVEEIVRTAESGLRQLALSAESPAVLARSFPALLEHTVSAFGQETGIAADLRLAGDIDSLTGSQRIALLHVIEEALTNVREHSGAGSVRVCIARARDRVEVEISDNGRGFEVERTLVKAARRGRLGLVGMSERTLLLGGSFDIRSRPGGPTTVALTLPEWRPLGSAEPDTASVEDLDAVVLWT
jgi:signal transduction histidine kinase